MNRSDVTPPTVLALHGSASSGRQWRVLTDALAGRRAAIAPDLPGYGPQSDGDRLRFLAALMQGIAGPVDLVAHSFGCAIAMRLANSTPDRVRRVVLFDPVVPHPKAPLPEALNALWQSVKGRKGGDVMAPFFAYWAAPGAWDRLPEARRAKLAEHANSVQRDFLELTSGYWTLPRQCYRGPLTLLCGGRSPAAIDMMSRHMMSDYPQARRLVLPDLDHMAPITSAAEVTAIIMRCLGEMPDAAGATPALTRAA